ncbi:MAG: diaminopimelate epimerase [Rikenellaceae bacterium MAG02]
MPLYKFHGVGNDFVLLDARNIDDSNYIKNTNKICDRHFGIGADGIIFLKNSVKDKSKFSMIYYNYDGTKADMCGNGARCICAFANLLGIVDVSENFIFDTDDGIHRAVIHNRRNYLWDIEISINILSQINKINDDLFFVNTGVPHLVKFVDDIDTIDVYNEGKKYRYSTQYFEKGININFVQYGDNIKIRTYERGVEGETQACGTGVCATAIVINNLFNKSFPISIHTQGGELQINEFIENEKKILTLRGPATLVFITDKYYL